MIWHRKLLLALLGLSAVVGIAALIHAEPAPQNAAPADSQPQLAAKAGNAIVPRRELLKQIDQLQKENQEQRFRLQQADATAQENSRLRQYFNLPQQVPWKLKIARVVARDPANWWHTIKIDAGSRDGVATNSPVLTAEGYLVGRVSDVGFAHSQVVLLGDPDCRVSVLIEETRDNGVIASASSSQLDNTIVDLGYLSRNSVIKPGQRVVTSGLGGIFPKGILIGQIVDSRTVEFGLYNEARVRLAVKMNSLEEVFVKLP
jgi:rod shape-determining protein MreC